MDTCDVLIVGGGPAGSSCAWKLVRHGLDVMVLDRSAFPRDKVCAGWVTPAVIDALDIDIGAYGEGRVLQPITGFRTGLINGGQIETDYGKTVSYGIRRCEFDHYLLERAGARLRLGESLDAIRRTDEGWLVNGDIRTSLLIGAGGHFCPVARFLGAKPGSSELTVVAKEVEFQMDAAQARACTVRPETPELFFCEDLKGYGWCFRKGDYLNIGLGREDRHRLTEKLCAFAAWLTQCGKIPENIPTRYHGHAYLLYQHAPRKLCDDRVLLVGDAAGLAYPQSGEGIRPAIESGLLAAEAVLGVDKTYGREGLQAYSERLRVRFGKAGRHNPASSRWSKAVQSFLGRRLLANPWFVRHLVLDRWFLHVQQPALDKIGSA